MPTQINRQKLIEAVDITVEADRKAWESERERVRKLVADRQAEWVAEWNPKWTEAVKQIQQAISDGKPVTRELLPHSGGSIEYFTRDGQVRIGNRWYDEPAEDAVFKPRSELVALKNACLVVADEHVTPNALDALGVTKSALRDAVQAMGRETIKEKN